MEKSGSNRNIVKKFSRPIILFLPNLLISANQFDMQGNTLIHTSSQLKNTGIVCGSTAKVTSRYSSTSPSWISHLCFWRVRIQCHGLLFVGKAFNQSIGEDERDVVLHASIWMEERDDHFSSFFVGVKVCGLMLVFVL